MSRPLLICFDGSEPSRHALAEAGRLFRDGPAIVLHVYQSLLAFTPGYPLAGFSGGLEVSEELASEAAERAQALADQGVELARAAGMEAIGHAELTSDPPWKAIVDFARERDVAAVVMGTRGLSNVRSALLGSVSNGVIHHSDRPVLVVPPPKES